MTLILTNDEREHLINAIKCCNLPDKTALWKTLKRLENNSE